MRAVERQSRIEYEVHQMIDDIAEEIGLCVFHYPEVYWFGKKLKFEDLLLPEREREEFEEFRDERVSACCSNRGIIFIAQDIPEHLSEEAGHFLHYTLSKIGLGKTNHVDYLLKNIISECVGYFCSKLICPDRKFPLERYKDRLPLDKKNFWEFHKRFMHQLEINETNWDNEEFLIYQQGYGLGQALFNDYVCGQTSKRELRQLIKDPQSTTEDAFRTFLGLKERLWAVN